MEKLDRTQIFGLVLILIIFGIWQYVISPSPEELAEQQRLADSIALVNQTAETPAPELAAPAFTPEQVEGLTDSARQAQFGGTFGPFAASAAGLEEEVTIENDLMVLTLSTKGGGIKRVELKDYAKVVEDENKTESKLPLYLMNDERDRFEYILPVNGVSGEGIRTGDLYFTPTVEGQTVVMRAPATGGGYFEQRYTLEDGTYLLDYDIRFEGLQQVLAHRDGVIKLDLSLIHISEPTRPY